MTVTLKNDSIMTDGTTLLILLFLVLFLVRTLFLLLLFVPNVFVMVFLVLLPLQLRSLFLVHLPQLADPGNNKNTITLMVTKGQISATFFLSLAYYPCIP